jgi:hypothetical protein
MRGRSEVIALGTNLSDANLSELLKLIVHEVGDNNRESAIKALSQYGGQFVVHQLEEIAHRGDSAKFGQGAAVKALEALGVAPNKELVFNPDSMSQIFKGAIISKNLQEPLRGTVEMANVIGLAQLDDRMIGFSVAEAQRCRFDFAIEFDFSKAEERFKAFGLKVNRKSEKTLEVSGDAFPGFAWKKPKLHVVFRGQDGGTISVFCEAISKDADCGGFLDVARLMGRLAVWGGGPRVQEKLPKVSKTSAVISDDTNNGLMDLAVDIHERDK